MTRVRRTMSASPQQVWDVLADGWLYPLWVVGASRMREVDETWPSLDTRLHHSVGGWPLLIDDTTRVLESIPRQLLRLHAHAWPTGKAEVVLRLKPVAAGTEVSIEEDAVSGPARLMPSPARAPLLQWRNTETLRRLAYLAERRRQ